MAARRAEVAGVVADLDQVALAQCSGSVPAEAGNRECDAIGGYSRYIDAERRVIPRPHKARHTSSDSGVQRVGILQCLPQGEADAVGGDRGERDALRNSGATRDHDRARALGGIDLGGAERGVQVQRQRTGGHRRGQRYLESGAGAAEDIAAIVNLDPIQPVLASRVIVQIGQLAETWRQCARGRLQRAQRSALGDGEGLRSRLGACYIAGRQRHDFDLHDGLEPRSGVGSAQGDLAHRVVFQVCDEPAPDLQVNQGRQCGSVRGDGDAGRIGEIGLGEIGGVLIEAAEDAIDVTAPAGDVKVIQVLRVGAGGQGECRAGGGHAARTHHIAQLQHHQLETVENIVIPIRIEPDAALLVEHAIVVPGGVEWKSGKIAFHGVS